MTKHKPDIRFTLTIHRPWHDSDFTKAILRVGVMTSSGELHNPGYAYRDDPDYPANIYKDLVITAQRSDRSDNGAEAWYGWETAFADTGTVTLDEAKRMVTVLTRVQRGTDTHTLAYGYPATFADYAAIVARTLGATAAEPFAIAGHTDRWSWFGVDTLRHKLAKGDLT